MMKITILFLLTLQLFIYGCGRVSESTLNSVLEKDPSFRKTLNAKRRIKEEIISLKEAILPEIERLKERLEKTHSEYKAKTKLLKDSLHRLKSIKKLLTKKADLSLSGDEISIWNKRAANLEEEIAALRKDIEELRNRISLLKIEVRILQE